MDINLKINGKAKGTVPYGSIASLQLFCVQHNLETDWNEEQGTFEIRSRLKGKKVWVLVNTGNEEYDEEILNKMNLFLQHYGIEITRAEKKRYSEGDLFVDLQAIYQQIENTEIALGTNKRLKTVDARENFKPYLPQVVFKGYYYLENDLTHDIPHLQCKVRFSEHNRFFTSELPILLSNCIVKFILQSDQASFIDLNIDRLLMPFSLKEAEGKNVVTSENELSAKNKNRKKEDSQEDRDYLEAKRKKASKMKEKSQKAEVYFDYNVMPNRELDRYSVKADFLIKNTGNTELLNPKVCFRMDPTDKIEIGGQILPPEMSEIFSVQGNQGAQGWQYMGKDWLEKAYETGEYWIESVQDLTIMPDESAVIEGIQFTIESLEKQDVATIVGFVYFNNQRLQVSSNNKIMISF
ncbi:hypothetical protein JOC86_003494 [Bacillus pakistanensis]|uniref:Uncharacterized protein n=1 Tax=Rossellomorea pakistanensis TaxID=992288 RepID=A0ABS2NGF4_9BACI|nr:hypothetical protein [Bacillus pakistanensis]MBM7586942.1 hypothetical protein [Bacillus pakistanensis]